MLVVAHRSASSSTSPRRGRSSAPNRESLNVEGAFQHILTDLAAFVATAIAGVVILRPASTQADGIASLIVAAIMLRAAYGLLRESGRVFLEAAPRGHRPRGDRQRDGGAARRRRGPRPARLGGHLGLPGALRARPRRRATTDCHADAPRARGGCSHERFAIEHTTLQVDHEGGDLAPDRGRLRGGPAPVRAGGTRRPTAGLLADRAGPRRPQTCGSASGAPRPAHALGDRQRGERVGQARAGRACQREVQLEQRDQDEAPRRAPARAGASAARTRCSRSPSSSTSTSIGRGPWRT